MQDRSVASQCEAFQKLLPSNAPVKELTAKIWNSGIAKSGVKLFNNCNGYCFIETDQEHDVLFRFSAIEVDRFKSVSESDRVRFDEEGGAKGLQAVKVKKL
jgi:CspA family cold shock protein